MLPLKLALPLCLILVSSSFKLEWGFPRRHQCLFLQGKDMAVGVDKVIGDEYDAFAEEFEATLRQHDWANNRFEAKIPPPELSKYYRRDKRDERDISIVDPKALGALLDERFHARRQNDFSRVSRIDQQLTRDFGVRAYDHPPIWTRLKEPPISHLRKLARKRSQSRKDQYGPTGHPYVQVGSKNKNSVLCPISYTEIHNLVSKRTICREEGRYEEADAILFELKLHGVRINDELYQWTFDRDHSFTPECQFPVRAVPVYSSTASLANLGEKGLRMQQRVTQLLQFRSEAIVRGEDELSQFITFELRKTYNVTVDDNTLIWSISADGAADESVSVEQLMPFHVETACSLLFDDTRAYDSPSYRESTLSLPIENEAIRSRVEYLVQERMHKREECKYLEADAIRNELWFSYNVGVNDRLKQYSVGGVYDSNG